MIITHRVVIGDAQRLYRDFYVSTRSCIELSYLARYVEKGRWPGPLRDLISLARLVHTYEGVWLAKGGNIQTSNWESKLSNKQIICTFEFKFILGYFVLYLLR